MGDAYVTFLTKVPAEYVPSVEKAISHAADVLADPNAPKEAYDAVQAELSHWQRTVGMDVAEAWKSEIESQLKERLFLQGLSASEVEALLVPKITKLLNDMEWCRDKIQSFGPPVRKFVAWKLAAVTGVAIGLYAFISSYQQEGRALKIGIEEEQRQIEMQREYDASQSISNIVVSVGEFQQMTEMVASPPEAQAVPLEVAAPIAPAIAVQPMEVTVIRPNQESHHYQSTVGAIVSTMPSPWREETAKVINSGSTESSTHHIYVKQIEVKAKDGNGQIIGVYNTVTTPKSAPEVTKVKH
jgi:hypothetical protein